MKHVVMFSGGLGSYLAAKRVVADYGAQNTTLLFCDTMMEDEDLYRFLKQATAKLGAPLVRLCDGRTPWQVFFDVRFLGNSQRDPCSKVLKREISAKWVKANLMPEESRLYVGIDWSEKHRFERIAERNKPWVYLAPLCDPPYLSPAQARAELAADGIALPRLYAMGFSHNNCGGFCIKAGQAHFANLLEKMPERYALHETLERRFQKEIAAGRTVLKDRRGGRSIPLSLRDFRLRAQGGAKLDKNDWGGCGCFAGDIDADQETLKDPL